MHATIQKWGNSLAIRIPKKVANKVGFEEGTEVEIVVIKDNIVLRPVKEYHTLDEILNQ